MNLDLDVRPFATQLQHPWGGTQPPSNFFQCASKLENKQDRIMTLNPGYHFEQLDASKKCQVQGPIPSHFHLSGLE